MTVSPSRTKLSVGVLGGMGPDATVDFMSKVLAATQASSDQDHIRMLVDHNPRVPDRSAAIIDGIGDPGAVLAEMAKRLQRAGADFLVMPCNTAHAFQRDIEAAIDIPFASIIDETVAACRGIESIGVLATVGCKASGIYQEAFAAANVSVVLLDDAETIELMQLVAEIKSGNSGTGTTDGMRKLADALIARGAAGVVAGCTEIPLVLESSMIEVPLFSSTDILADATVAYASGTRDLNS
ncbi:MAG: amino acid racemase [Gammaproteobacteria bacterium]|nr:amino acid racemase [Gammaproteobacteria bacterium]